MPHARITDPDITLNDLMEKWPQTIPVFMRHRMLCVGCLINPFHTVSDACAEYDLSEDAFVSELVDAVNAAG
ncbi:DUF1858 domain-containing protein [Rhizobium sp. L1K21]|uniref:DUF1858 domain-containing protein n=1 Tax=Rhizobium sp. L1K21 TaxID=2954933 RepID=UPI0020936FF0|nr:DUF1858 domain-containing protein [Rhizobium sp. L1K21]MCO6187762.1 DUF1858 domain-containing protein [Rhizobium sp. L1K21]